MDLHNTREMKCEACGVIRTAVYEGEYVFVRTTNGGLQLCQQCLDDINRKNPETERLRERVAKLEAEQGRITEAITTLTTTGEGKDADRFRSVAEMQVAFMVRERDELAAERERVANLLIAEEEMTKRLAAELATLLKKKPWRG